LDTKKRPGGKFRPGRFFLDNPLKILYIRSIIRYEDQFSGSGREA
jgi:hypothetical protein